MPEEGDRVEPSLSGESVPCAAVQSTSSDDARYRATMRFGLVTMAIASVVTVVGLWWQLRKVLPPTSSEAPSTQSLEGVQTSSADWMGVTLSGGYPTNGLAIKLVADKEEFFLGENILLHYCIENTGDKPFTPAFGGDYRGGTRADRFKVRAVGSDGTEVPDPEPVQMNMGGLSSLAAVHPGKEWFQDVYVNHYCRFEKPGDYVVTVYHDLGGAARRTNDVREAMLILKLRVPTDSQARKVLAEMDAASSDNNRSAGQKGKPVPDYCCIRHPAYLSVLAERAAKGTREGFAGLASIATPDATRVLVALMESAAPEIRNQATDAVMQRLPDPQFDGRLGPRWIFDNPRLAPRRWLNTNSWLPEFSPPVRSYALQLLSFYDDPSLNKGAFILECIGQVEDLPVLLRALDVAVMRTIVVPRETQVYPVPRGACRELLRAARVLLSKGAVTPEHPRTAGEWAFYAVALEARPESRPPGWQGNVTNMLRHDCAYVRELALVHLPNPTPNGTAEMLGPLMLDSDLDVQIAASRLVAHRKLQGFEQFAARVLAAAQDRWLREAAESIVKAGATR